MAIVSPVRAWKMASSRMLGGNIFARGFYWRVCDLKSKSPFTHWFISRLSTDLPSIIWITFDWNWQTFVLREIVFIFLNKFFYLKFINFQCIILFKIRIWLLDNLQNNLYWLGVGKSNSFREKDVTWIYCIDVS